MTRQSDLLPWILGALLIATVAIAITAGSMQGAPTPPAAAAVAAVPVPAPSAEPAVAAAVAAPAAPAVLAEAPEQALPPPLERSGQIWECTTKGVKTFSNKPCGEKSAASRGGSDKHHDSDAHGAVPSSQFAGSALRAGLWRRERLCGPRRVYRLSFG